MMSEQLEVLRGPEVGRVPLSPSERRPGDGMTLVGHLLAWPGVILIAVAFFFSTSVETGSSFVDGVGLVGGGEVTNLARQQMQLLLALAGGLAFIAGVVLTGFGAVLNQLAALRPS